MRENFNETKYIGFFTYILLLLSIAHYPVVFVVIENWYVASVSCLINDVSNFIWFVGLCSHTESTFSFSVPSKTLGIRQVEGVEFLLWKLEQELSPSQSMPEYLTAL